MHANKLIIVVCRALAFFIEDHFRYLPDYQNFNFDERTTKSIKNLIKLVLRQILLYMQLKSSV